MSYKQTESKSQCPRCAENGRDSKGDNLHNYGKGKGSFCFSCNYAILSDDEKERRGIDTLDDFYEGEEVSTKETITQEEIDKVKSYTGTKGCNLRGITDATYKAYSIRHKYSEETGEPVEQYYPILKDNTMSGFKIRILPKDFSTIGKVGKESDMFGQFKFWNTRGKFVVITAGEVDCLSAFQMLEDYRKSRNSDFEPIPVVSSVIGESGSHKQIQLHYEWFNRFEKILICYDSDDAGREAVHKVAKVLPKGKTFIMELPLKDVNAMLEASKEKQFIDCFFKAKAYSPAGIVSSQDIYKEIVERAKVDKLPFPPMMDKVNKMLAGGVNFGYICNILAGSGAGKSSLINQCVSYWMQELDMNVGVVSLEAEAGEFGENLLSHYLGKKIALMTDKQERIDFVGSEHAEKAAHELFHREDGSSRLFLLDDRGEHSTIQDKIEELIISCNCKIIVIDVVSDLFGALPLDEVEKYMSWMKKIIKQYNCIFFNISHVRKAGGGEKAASQGAFLTEESTIGSGAQYRSAGVNIALQRDKNNEDEIERNTTKVHLLKSRATGCTGHACDLFYDANTHTLWDKDEYFSSRGVEFS